MDSINILQHHSSFPSSSFTSLKSSYNNDNN